MYSLLIIPKNSFWAPSVQLLVQKIQNKVTSEKSFATTSIIFAATNSCKNQIIPTTHSGPLLAQKPQNETSHKKICLDQFKVDILP